MKVLVSSKSKRKTELTTLLRLVPMSDHSSLSARSLPALPLAARPTALAASSGSTAAQLTHQNDVPTKHQNVHLFTTSQQGLHADLIEHTGLQII